MIVQVTATLKGDQAIDFEAFREVTMAARSTIVRDSLAIAMAKVLAENPGLRERYARRREELRLLEAAPVRGHLKVVK